MDDYDIRKIAQEEIEKALDKAQYGVKKVPFHVHNNIDAPPIAYINIINAPQYFTVATDTNGTTNVNVFGTGGAPFPMTIIGVYLISKDTTAGNITVLRRADTVCTIAKGTTTAAMVGATSLSNTVYRAGDTCQVDSSSAGNATVFITFAI
jgi:hypothetical protein